MTRSEQPETGERWQRLHENGWLVVVTYQGNGRYGYTVRDLNTAGSVILEGFNIRASLHYMQALADAKVPPHDCGACQNWSPAS